MSVSSDPSDQVRSLSFLQNVQINKVLTRLFLILLILDTDVTIALSR